MLSTAAYQGTWINTHPSTSSLYSLHHSIHFITLFTSSLSWQGESDWLIIQPL